MAEFGTNQEKPTAAKRYTTLMRYGGAALAVWLALSLWSLSAMLHRHPFTLFLAAVLLTARFLGFGPALFCSLLSTACLDLFVLVPRLSLALTNADWESLGEFLVISLFAGSMARQKSRAELRADRTTHEMAAIVEYSDDAIFSKSKDGTITSWNRGAERLYGYSAQEAVGASVYQLAPPERRKEVEANLQVFNRGGRVEPYQTERLRKDGTLVPVVLSVSPLRNAKGAIVGASVITRDISAQKQSEEAVRRSEKLATAGRLAASIAHEINNPLEAVVNLLYLARHDSSNAQQYLTMAEREVGRIARLAQQTLGFVRDTGSPGWMDPAAIMDEILELYSHKLEGRSIRVTRRYRNRSQISGYSGEVRQLLANLLVNAIDAMADGGSLQVRVAAGRQWCDGREGIRITVADNGSGIPRESLRRIFEPFYSTKKDSGTGLGLWVSRGIVRKHGGSIRVRSRAEGGVTGTMFMVFLPYRYHMSLVA
ncbi:MAG TPA: PAS domain S-box protein [Terriglobales bacterium]|nr:PAS domain S-box protein [Terriglobales bacterium]